MDIIKIIYSIYNTCDAVNLFFENSTHNSVSRQRYCLIDDCVHLKKKKKHWTLLTKVLI